MKKAFFILFVLLFLFTPNAWSGGISGAGGGFANGVQDFFQNYNQGQQNVRANEALRLERERLELQKKELEQQLKNSGTTASPGFIFDLSQNNGTAWNNLNEFAKINFLQGFGIGSSYVAIGAFRGVEDENDQEGNKLLELAKRVLLAQDKKEKNKQIMFTQEETQLWGNFMSNVEGNFRNNLLVRYMLPKITTGQMKEGLDTLYRDFKNVNILIPDAIYIVKRQINGGSVEETEAILQYLRSGRDSGKLNYTDKDGKQKKAIFP
ncbi:MAG: hypothetical protein BWY02_02783 [bacterium ADurb.Bin157]|nr:MAG: hypothetical protein BWY02_02783 [bacterium ADurb.Bin157]